jgi:ketosteroid isomerase-like protein
MNLVNTRVAAIAVGALLLTATFAGCGGSDDGSGALSKEDFIAQADQVCADFSAEAKKTEEAFNTAIQEDDMETAGDLFAANAEQMDVAVEEFADLTPPEADQETIDKFVSLSREQVDAAFELADAIAANDEQAVQAIDEEARGLDAEADLIADEYGMVDCGSAGG